MIVLASKSASRQAMLDAAGVRFVSFPADINERAVEAALPGHSPAQIALALAQAKAQAVSQIRPEALVLGSDSLVTVNGHRFDKPASREQAGEHLRFFSGRMMELHSAAALARGGSVWWSHAEVARLAVRKLSEDFIADYLAQEWPMVAGCVGVFRIEARGVQLFETIEGDHFTVLGMPLLQVLSALRRFGELPA